MKDSPAAVASEEEKYRNGVKTMRGDIPHMIGRIDSIGICQG